MGKLALLWDGAWLRWALPHESQARQREISRADMVPEVLTALRNQVGAGSDVVCAEWGASTTMVPTGDCTTTQDRDVLVGAHARQHGPTSQEGVRVEAFNRGGTRCHLVTSGDPIVVQPRFEGVSASPIHVHGLGHGPRSHPPFPNSARGCLGVSGSHWRPRDARGGGGQSGLAMGTTCAGRMHVRRCPLRDGECVPPERGRGEGRRGLVWRRPTDPRVEPVFDVERSPMVQACRWRLGRCST